MAIAIQPASLDDAVLSHYRLVAPIMEANFGHIPIVWTTYADSNPQTKPDWHGKYFGHYSHLSSEHVQHLVSIGAREFYSWVPLPDDMNRCRFLRFPLERPNVSSKMLMDAAHALREVLREDGRETIPLLDGEGNVTLWVPVSGGPDYASARAYCYTVAKRLVEREPDLVSLVPNTHADGRVHLHVAGNAVGRFSMLPYSFRRKTGRVATPIMWDELGQIDIEGLCLADFANRFAIQGDVFAQLLAAMQPVPLPDAAKPLVMSPKPHTLFNGMYANAAVVVLSDGVPRTSQELYDEALKRGLITKSTVASFHDSLVNYVLRRQGRDRKTPFIQTVDHKWALNEPPDNWPVQPWTEPALSASDEKIVERLKATSSGDPDGFEQAVCDAFAALNLAAVHVGGIKAPDGYMDAPLGPLGYRVMIECKSGYGQHPNVWEAAKYREAYGAQYCAMVAPQFGDEKLIREESVTHGVSIWNVGDLVTALTIDATPLELQPAFAGGVAAADVLFDLVWDRRHGERKRVQIIADYLHQAGWATQCAATQAGKPNDAPILNADAAMLLVDQELLAQKCPVSCTRDEVRLAFEHLTNPLVDVAVWTDATKSAIVVVSPPH